MYEKSFYIEGEVGNNAFSFKRRQDKKLYVTNIINGTIDDVKLGTEKVFEDFDFDGKLVSFSGLKNFVKFDFDGKECIIFDNHNHAFYFWCEAYKNKIIDLDAKLIHIDEHSDMRDPNIYIENNDLINLEKIFDYTNFTLNVGNYIIPAIKSSLVKEVYQIRNETNIKEFNLVDDKNIILNIDLDFFSPGLDFIDYQLKLDFIKKMIKKSSFITIASSPFFIDQTLAIKVFKDIFK
ncbi:MAG: UPF0489 family protein [Candidatus Gracilibacteria bacterium]|nr:UPF0489 family protein [Candidatus Gracilibacteria bacterium]